MFGCSAMAAPGMRYLSIKHPLPEHDRNENSPVARYLPLATGWPPQPRSTTQRTPQTHSCPVYPDPVRAPPDQDEADRVPLQWRRARPGTGCHDVRPELDGLSGIGGEVGFFVEAATFSAASSPRESAPECGVRMPLSEFCAVQHREDETVPGRAERAYRVA